MKKINESFNKNDGELFEYKVALILKKQYPAYKFVHTVYKHDGGKDFYAVTNKEKIWVEAKCYNRHLELSRIAGTFIMADIYQINKIIIFSKSKLMEGAFINLAKYCSLHNKTLIIYNESDINNLIIKNKKITVDEIKSIDIKYQGIDKLINLTAKEIKEKITQKRKEKKYDAEYACLLMAFTYKKFNDIVDSNSIIEQNSKIQKYDGAFYLQNNSSQQEILKKEINAFDFFSAEFVLRNPSVTDIKSVNVDFNYNNEYCCLVKSKNKSIILEPGQCIAVKYYFRALCNVQIMKLPQLTICCDNEKNFLDMRIDNKDSVTCRVIGEAPYLGVDSNYLSQLNILLSASDRLFSTVLLYGKSGVGKSRFLYELKNARMQDGNQCFLFGGDFQCSTVFDFLRQLLLSYYDFNFDDNTGKIVLPHNLKELLNTYFPNNTINLILDILNCNYKSFDITSASNWLTYFLKNNNITLLIDNAQNLNKEIVSFMNNIIDSLKLCKCKSEIVLVFNTDMIIPLSLSSNIFNYYKNNVPESFKYNLVGFDKGWALTYLQYCLDPKGTRKDIANLCLQIIEKVDTNPLFLKQIILYLYQKQIIGFVNQSICLLSVDSIAESLADIPENINDIIKYRFNLLLKNSNNQQKQIYDLFWSIIIFGAFPAHLNYCIQGIENDTVKKCIELGFIKYGENNTLIFEHQLIAKAILIALQNDAYTPNPAVNKIGLRNITAKEYLNKLSTDDKYGISKFIIKDYLGQVKDRDYDCFLTVRNYNGIINNLFPLIIRLVDKYNKIFHLQVSSQNVVKGIYNLMISSQNKFGANKTYNMFTDIIYYQIANYQDNFNCVHDFIELLKYYFHETPNVEKQEFIVKFEKIGTDLLQKNNDYKHLSDFQIWIKWAVGKNQMHLHNFYQALKSLNKGKRLAKQANNLHRLAEIYVQCGYLFSYLDNKKMTVECWKKASKYYKSEDIHNRVVKMVIQGNAALIEKNFELADNLCKNLSEIYNQPNCYAFLKNFINDFISNYLILKAVNSKCFDELLDKQIKNHLARFRSVAMTYKTDAYLKATYKTLTYYKYILSNYWRFRSETENATDIELVRILCEELISNYQNENSDFTYFYPIFKDIADIAKFDNSIEQYISSSSLSDKYFEMKNAYVLSVFPHYKRGVLSDNNGKVNLYHISYTW